MLKKLIFASIFCTVFLVSVFHASGQQPTTPELELAGLIMNADRSLDLSEPHKAESYLLQAKQIILQNPNISNNLQGHYNKVAGKMYMKSSLNQALVYFNNAISRFSGNALEQARVDLFIGIAYYHAGDLNASAFYFGSSKEYFILSEDDANLAQTLNNLGVVAFRQGNAAAAIDYCEQALLINNEENSQLNAVRNQLNLNYFIDLSTIALEEYYQALINDLGGGGTSGSGTTITTNGSGTVVAGGGSGNGGSVN